MHYTLRQIADSLWKTRGDRQTDEERQRIYDRARMLRDKGLICSSEPSSQGRTMTFTEADTAAAVVALTASLNGMSWGVIEQMNGQLRAIGNTMGKPMFEANLSAIKAGAPIYARVDLLTQPWSQTIASMGGLEVLSAHMEPGTTQVLIWPVTQLAKPVLELLEAE